MGMEIGNHDRQSAVGVARKKAKDPHEPGPCRLAGLSGGGLDRPPLVITVPMLRTE